MRFEERVLYYEFQLNDTDDEVVNYIRKHKDNIKNISIQKIAEELYTVPNTVMRLCKKLGYKGYAELKVLLTQEVQEEKHNELLFDRIPQSITKTLNLIDYDKLMIVAEKMKKCETVHFIGIGDSRLDCELMVKNLMCQDKKAVSYIDYHDIDFRVGHCHEKDLLVFISMTGETERIIEVAQKAKKRNIEIVTITHFCENSLASLADIPLYFWGEQRKVNGYNVTDRLGIGLLLRQLSETFWRTYWI